MTLHSQKVGLLQKDSPVFTTKTIIEVELAVFTINLKVTYSVRRNKISCIYEYH